MSLDSLPPVVNSDFANLFGDRPPEKPGPLSVERATVLPIAEQLLASGFAVHWLRPRQKKPIEPRWSELPVHTVDTLRAQHRSGANLGARLGEWSETGAGYLHVLDLDIRKPGAEREAWAWLDSHWPQWREFPTVASGSGGESRHVYFLTSEPFHSRLLAKSETFDLLPDPKRPDRPGKRYQWQVELLGTGKQVVLPPSIHPDTGRSYRWLRPLPPDLMELGPGPTLPVSLVKSWGAAADRADGDGAGRDDGAREHGPADWDRVDSALEWLDPNAPREEWLGVGMALHHASAGSEEGFRRFNEWSAEATREDDRGRSIYRPREMRRQWKSFGNLRDRRPVTLGTLFPPG